MSLLTGRSYYKPFDYVWAWEAYDEQAKMHWLPKEVSLNQDKQDWNHKLTDYEKDLLTQLFRFFVQSDVDIAGGYIDHYMPMFKAPEVRMMLSTFAAMEAIHIHAYSMLIDEVNMPEIEYSKFLEYAEMKDKHDFMANTGVYDIETLLRSMAIFSAFGEGLQLFSSFAILLNFTRHKKMAGMGQIVSYSIKDETLHVESMIKLFHALLEEHPRFWTKQLHDEIYTACFKMVELEDKFIDLAFAGGQLEDLTADEVKEYIRFIADRRLQQLGLQPHYNISKNPLVWVDYIVNGAEHTNFFENRATAYAKASFTGSWEDAWTKI